MVLSQLDGDMALGGPAFVGGRNRTEFLVMAIVFKRGDIVKHRHLDGPEMMVEFHQTEYMGGDRIAVIPPGVQCAWFDKNHLFHQCRFTPEDVVLVRKSECAS